MRISKSFLKIFFLIIILFLFQTKEIKAYTLKLDQNTVKRGYTVKAFNQKVIIGIWPKIFNKPVKVHIKKIKSKNISLPKNKKLISPIWEIKFLANRKTKLKGYFTLLLKRTVKRNGNFYIKEKNKWKKISTLKINSDYFRTHLKKKSFIIALFTPKKRSTKPDYAIWLDENTVKRGYTIIYKNLIFAVWPYTFKNRVKIEIYRIRKKGDFPKNQNRISDIYRIKIKPQTKEKPRIPFTLVLNLNKNTSRAKLWYKRKKWKKISNYHLINGNRSLRANIKLLDFTVGGGESISYYQGIASWYYSSQVKYGAAINIFPIGTRLKVTNLSNGKWVEVKVVSHGLSYPGRLIDLTHRAFKKLASLSKGLIRVKIEKL